MFREQYGRAPKVEAIHAGVECGLLAGEDPGLTASPIGPDLLEIPHPPGADEHLLRPAGLWAFLLEVLRRSR